MATAGSPDMDLICDLELALGYGGIGLVPSW